MQMSNLMRIIFCCFICVATASHNINHHQNSLVSQHHLQKSQKHFWKHRKAAELTCVPMFTTSQMEAIGLTSDQMVTFEELHTRLCSFIDYLNEEHQHDFVRRIDKLLRYKHRFVRKVNSLRVQYDALNPKSPF